MQKCIISSESNVASLLLHHQLLIALLVLCLKNFFVGCKIDLSVGVEQQVAFDEIGFKILYHGIFGLGIIDFFLGFL